MIEVGKKYERRDGTITEPLVAAGVAHARDEQTNMIHIIGRELPSHCFGKMVEAEHDLVKVAE